MPLFGILNINKPSGISSRAAVNRVERLTRPVRCGHAGTLDPLASGVLVICVGSATRLVQYVQRMPKRYRATFLLGCQSETDDIEGDVTQLVGARHFTRAEIDIALTPFLGEILQRPPTHSAVKIAGRRAYSLARRGEQVELAPRPVTIHSLAIVEYAYPDLVLDIECGSGTYVRALGRDLAISLGTAAVMSALVRTAIGSFRVEEAIELDELTNAPLSTQMLPALRAVPEMPTITFDAADLQQIRNGRPVELSIGGDAELHVGGDWAALDGMGQLVGLVRQKRPGEFWPAMNFMTE